MSKLCLWDDKVFLSFQTIDGERRALKRQETASASFSEANKIEEIYKPRTGKAFVSLLFKLQFRCGDNFES